MLNQKLKTIATLVKKEDVVIDIGCDHAYLAIDLKENNRCKEVYASDISTSVLEIAKSNIKKSKCKIEAYLSDGFKDIPKKGINTAIISGMGTSTILKIIKDAPRNIEKYILSSNNDHELLRKKMKKQGFYIEEEKVIYENNKYYPIMLFAKTKQKENNLTLKYGKSRNKEYYQYLLKKEEEIIKKIPKKYFFKRLAHQKNKLALKKLL